MDWAHLRPSGAFVNWLNSAKTISAARKREHLHSLSNVAARKHGIGFLERVDAVR